VAAVLPIMGALCWASTLMFTRRLGGIDPPLTTLTFSALVGFVLLSALVWIAWAPLSWPQLMMGALIGIASTTGHYLVILAYRHGDASVLSPYAYSQLIWATAFSWSVFGSIPELWTYAGAAVIIASGLFTAYRERSQRRGAA
jgi:drug/metabolite transporter (DMT)-like permease